jgi:RecB family endonuclease NucS
VYHSELGLDRHVQTIYIENDMDPQTIAELGAKHHLANARHLAVEVKRIAGLEAVEQLTRYVELLNRDPQLAPVGGILAAQTIKPQARTLATDRGLQCVTVDYDALRGIEPSVPTLF